MRFKGLSSTGNALVMAYITGVTRRFPKEAVLGQVNEMRAAEIKKAAVEWKKKFKRGGKRR